MKLSEMINFCKPAATGEPLHWSEKFINNFWLWKVSCDCCHKWRLLLAGFFAGLLPLMILALVKGYFLTCAVYTIALAVFIAIGALAGKTNEPK